MSLRPNPLPPVPEETARVTQAAFPKGNTYLRLRDELGPLYDDRDFAALFPRRGQPGLSPGLLATVTVMQFLENLSDRQAAAAVRARIDWKYAQGLELTDPGVDFSVLSAFRARLVVGSGEQLLRDQRLERLRARGLVNARGQQRTDSTPHCSPSFSDLVSSLFSESHRCPIPTNSTVTLGLTITLGGPVEERRPDPTPGAGRRRLCPERSRDNDLDLLPAR